MSTDGADSNNWFERAINWTCGTARVTIPASLRKTDWDNVEMVKASEVEEIQDDDIILRGTRENGWK
jgi:hypothetical protein